MNTNLLESFNKARAEKKPLLIKGFMKEVPEWSDFIQNIYNKVNSEQLRQYTFERNLKDVVVYNFLDVFISYAANNEDENDIKGLQKVVDHLKEQLGVTFFNMKSIINFAGYEADYFIHEDPNDVISWHCIGNMEWRIHDGDSYESYYLNPGDLFYCPRGTVHQVVVSEPRASVILDYFNPLDDGIISL